MKNEECRMGDAPRNFVSSTGLKKLHNLGGHMFPGVSVFVTCIFRRQNQDSRHEYAAPPRNPARTAPGMVELDSVKGGYAIQMEWIE